MNLELAQDILALHAAQLQTGLPRPLAYAAARAAS